MDFSKLLQAAVLASQKASGEILKVYNSSSFGVELKDDKSPLTIADKKAHHAITEVLKPSGLPILSEEGKNIPYDVRKSWKQFWLIDPLDGTKEFINRNGEFTVNIAVIENHKPVLGVVAVPVTGEIYYGAKDIGAFKIVENKTQSLPSRSKVNQSAPGIRIVASRSHLNEETQQFIDSLNKPQLVSKGSSLKFIMLADGLADIYPRFAPTMEWDTAAAHAIINQIGYQVLQGGTNVELQYNKESLLNPGFIAL